MIVSVASGKGGTGKTTVSASLAEVWPDRASTPVIAVDLDVEEPNLHLFLHPELDASESVELEIPLLDEARCTRCRACAELCQFKAITVLGDIPMVFAEMCHGCGGCLLVCPEGALTPGTRTLGELVQGRCQLSAGEAAYLMGRLRVGEAMAPPLMRAVKQRLDALLAQAPGAHGGADAIIDAPPGVSCPAVNAVMDADVIVLVTEPTPFGLHDFRLAWQAFAPLGKPMGAVINRAGIGDTGVQEFCREHGLPVWAEIPYRREIAAAYARGEVVARLNNELRGMFTNLADHIRAAARNHTAEAAHV